MSHRPFNKALATISVIATFTAGCSGEAPRNSAKALKPGNSQDAATGPVLERAVASGYDIRIGFEDTLSLPDGSPAPDNAALVRATSRLIGRLS